MDKKIVSNLYEEDIDFRAIINSLYRYKIFILFVTFLFSFAAAILSIFIPDEYRSKALLAPASTSNTSSFSNLSGLASLAGFDMVGKGEDKTQMAMEILKTWGFLEEFILEEGIQVEVFAVTGWERDTNELKVDSSLYNASKGLWVGDNNSNRDGIVGPTSWELYKRLVKKISVEQSKKTGLISLSVEHYSPHLSKIWVEKLVGKINEHFKDIDRRDSLKRIEYLKRQIAETAIADMRSVFYQLIEEEYKVLMLAEVSDEYIFKVLSPPKVEEEKFKPKRLLIVVIGLFLGFSLSSIFVMIKSIIGEN